MFYCFDSGLRSGDSIATGKDTRLICSQCNRVSGNKAIRSRLYYRFIGQEGQVYVLPYGDYRHITVSDKSIGLGNRASPSAFHLPCISPNFLRGRTDHSCKHCIA